MIFKITEKDLNTLRGALEETLNHIYYNPHCFSCSDIGRAYAFDTDISRIFNILLDNSINIFEGSTDDFKEKFKGYNNECDFSSIKTPKTFEILLYSDAVWRVSKEFFNLKYSDEDVLKIDKECFIKYWSVITHGCAYEIAPNKDALLEFSKISYSLKMVLHLVLSEIENFEIRSIKAVLFDENELELEIKYIKENHKHSLYVYETPVRADIIVSSYGVPLKIYPTATGNQYSTTLYDKEFHNYYKKMCLEKQNFENMARNALDEKLNYINNNSSEFKDINISSLDGEIYSYWKSLKELDLLVEKLKTLQEGTVDYCYTEDDIDNLHDSCFNCKLNIEQKIFESLVPEDFITSLEKVTKQYNYMLDYENNIKCNDYVDYVFDFLSKDHYKNVI